MKSLFLLLAGCVPFCVLWSQASAPAQEIPDTFRVVYRTHTGVFVSGTENEPKGFDVDLVKRFISWQKARIGREVSQRAAFVDTLDALLEEARAGRCDMAIGSVTATEERDRSVDFSVSYLPVRVVLIAPPGRLPAGDYRQALVGKRVGAIQGSTHAQSARALEKEISGLSSKTDYPTSDDLFAALLRHPPEIDAAVTEITHYWHLKTRENVVLVEFLSPEQGIAFVFPEGSPLRPTVNAFLEEFLHSPSYFTLIRDHFGQEGAEMVRSARQK